MIDEAGWLEWRRGGIGGSDIAALIGLSRYASPTSLFYEKVGLIAPSEETARQRIGKRMEAVLAAEFHDETGLHVVGDQTWCQHNKYHWARCTVDGFVADSPYGSVGPDGDLSLGTVQMKTDGRFGWPDGIPANIRAQCIWEMGVTRLEHCWVIVMFAGFRVQVFEIDWDGEAQSDWEFMLAAADRFWHGHVLAGEPPPPDDHEATTAALTEIYHDPAGILDADDNARTLVTEVQAAQVRTKAAKSEEAQLKNELRAVIGEHTDLVDGTKPGKRKSDDPVPNVIASWREQDQSNVDLEGLRGEALALVAKHTTTDTIRVLRISKPKGIT